MATKKAETQGQEALGDVEAYFNAQDEDAEFPLPAGYENQTVGFARAYAHARAHGNGDKASLLFAEAHFDHFEATDDV